jgi:ABC-type transport system involved in cytochrome c biogenesis permease subunit
VTPLEDALHRAVVALFALSAAGYAAACGLHLESARVPARRREWNRMGFLPMAAALVGLAALLLTRGLRLGSIPFQSRYETYLFVMTGLSAGCVAFDFVGGLRKIRGRPGASIALVGAAAAATGLVFALRSRAEDFEALQKPPALQSNWIAVRTTCTLLGYGLLHVAVATAAVSLVLRAATKREDAGRLDWDRLVDAAMRIAFPFLTAGLFLGCIAGQEVWATYWGWDVEETWTLVAWAVFLVYFHLRKSPGMTGTMPALVVVLGGAAILVAWLGVHLLPESSQHVFD